MEIVKFCFFEMYEYSPPFPPFLSSTRPDQKPSLSMALEAVIYHQVMTLKLINVAELLHRARDWFSNLSV